MKFQAAAAQIAANHAKSPKKRKKCRNCKARHVNRPRGLCFTCYYKPGIRHQFPSESKFAGYKWQEPTEAELDALIAHQLRHLPPWWGTEKPEAYAYHPRKGRRK